MMPSSAEIYVLMKAAELNKRCGLKIDDIEAFVNYIDAPSPDPNYYELSFVGPSDHISLQAEKLFSLLGIKDIDDVIKDRDLSGLADKLDRALALAPRARSV
jgi:hypothetical protein